MELLCPHCLGALTAGAGDSVRCTIHGGQYQVLFSREKLLPMNPEPTVAPLAAGTKCARHPTVDAVHACRSCGTPICGVCGFPGPDGAQYCPVCVNNPPKLPPAVPAGMFCVQHPQVPATQKCQSCGGFMCGTCDFLMPGGMHLCPTCATNPRQELGPKRKKMLIAGIALAVWGTLGFVLLMGGAVAGYAETEEAQAVIGALFSVGVFIPSLIGLGISIGMRDSRLHNPGVIWVPLVWNAVLVGLFLLLTVIGLMEG